MLYKKTKHISVLRLHWLLKASSQVYLFHPYAPLNLSCLWVLLQIQAENKALHSEVYTQRHHYSMKRVDQGHRLHHQRLASYYNVTTEVGFISHYNQFFSAFLLVSGMCKPIFARSTISRFSSTLVKQVTKTLCITISGIYYSTEWQLINAAGSENTTIAIYIQICAAQAHWKYKTPTFLRNLRFAKLHKTCL